MTKRNSAEEKLARFITESAQQVWAAGLGALTVAEKEGSKLFETLSKLGESIEANTRKSAGAAGAAMQDAKHSAGESWDKLEAMFEKRVARALKSMQVPTADDIASLSRQVDDLSRAIDRLNSKLDTRGKSAAKPKKKKKKKKKTKKQGSKGKKADKK